MSVDVVVCFTVPLKANLLGRSRSDESRQRSRGGGCISRWAPKRTFQGTGGLKAGTDPINAKTRRGRVGSVHRYVERCRLAGNRERKKRGEADGLELRVF